MGGRWDQRDQWGDDWDQDDAGEDDYPSSRAPGRGSSQQRSYQPQRPYQSGQSYQQSYPQQQSYQPYASSNWGAAPSRARVRAQQREEPKRGAGPVIAGIVSLMAVAALVAFLARDQLRALLHRTPATTTPPALVLPAFSDWRVGYLGQDGKLHAVSLDGQTDVGGVSLPSLSAAGATGTPITGTPLAGAAASPDGHFLAYSGSAGPVLVHLTAKAADQDAVRSGDAVPSALLFSPDGAKLAWLGTNSAVHLTTIDTLADATVTGTTGQGITELLGWIDATHLAVRVAKTGATTEQVAALDTASGQLRGIVTLTKPGYGTLRYRLSPDGARFLAWNTPITGQAFTAIYRSYDTKTGAVRKLPNALRLIGTNLTAVTWKPGAATAAIASGSEATHDLRLWLLDAEGDSATSLGAAYPLGWLSDGSQLITSSANSATLGGGPFTITAVTVPASGPPSRVTLTEKAMTFPWLGLVRTA
jgi:hypothetical protein